MIFSMETVAAYSCAPLSAHVQALRLYKHPPITLVSAVGRHY